MLGIITVQWNSSKLTIELLSSIFKHIEHQLELFIVDNNSDKNKFDILRLFLESGELNSKQQKTILQRNKFNSGFSRACNIGIRYFLKTEVEWIWLLNNDAQIATNSIKSLDHVLEPLQPGIYGTTILNANGESETIAGYRFNLWTTRFRALTEDKFRGSEISDLWYVSGASMLVHRDVFDACGLLDESTFLYFEELDFCQRAKAQGFELGWVSEISVIHQGAASSQSETMKPKIMYHETWSTLYYYSKHHKYLFPYILIVRSFLRIFMLIIKNRSNEISSVFSATKDFIQGQNKDLVNVEITDRNYYQ